MTLRKDNPRIKLERIREVLRYCPLTGNFYHAVPRRRITVGSIAGTLCKGGYIVISIDGVREYAHRLAWFVTYGEWPHIIDHINGDRADNRIANLRNGKQWQNMGNSQIRRDNTSGYKGVSYFKRDGTWMAQIRCQGRYKFLGYYSTPEEAHEAYCRAAESLFGDFARAA